MRKFALSMIILSALATPALADDSCVTPYAPTVPDGAKATPEQMKTTLDEVKAFIKASDDYQSCLLLYLQQQTDDAKKDKKDVDASIKASVVAKGDANQREKERVGGQYNTAARAFKTAHP